MEMKSFKVLLVDDEQNTKNLLKLCIDWEALNMEVIADASCGIEALSIIEELHPDIVITDIEMPHMNGITLSKHILEHYMDIYVVIITAHEQFSYAQQAVSIGVSDFILKPIDSELITDTLQKLSQKIIQTRKKLTQLEMSYHYIKNNAMMLKEQFLNDLINGKRSNTSLFDELEITKSLTHDSSAEIQLALITILFDTSHYTQREKSGILQNCITYITETFCMNQNLHVFMDVHSHIVLLCNDHTLYLPELSERLTAYFKSTLQATVYCGIGTIASRLEDLPTSYEHAKNALLLCYTLDEDIVHHYDKKDMTHSHSLLNGNPLNHLVLLIKSGLIKEAIELVCTMLHDALQDCTTDLSPIKYEVINIFSHLVSELISFGIPASSFTFIDLSYSHLLHLTSYSDIEKYTTHAITELCHLTLKTHPNPLNDTITQIINYIETYYTDESLSLSAIAKQFYINPSYLSRVFKKMTNKSFTEYLVELRIQKAVHLLQLSNYKAYQLAQMVGIPDPNYFIKCFKKVTGKSLQDFKSQINII